MEITGLMDVAIILSPPNVLMSSVTCADCFHAVISQNEKSRLTAGEEIIKYRKEN